MIEKAMKANWDKAIEDNIEELTLEDLIINTEEPFRIYINNGEEKRNKIDIQDIFNDMPYSEIALSWIYFAYDIYIYYKIYIKYVERIIKILNDINNKLILSKCKERIKDIENLIKFLLWILDKEERFFCTCDEFYTRGVDYISLTLAVDNIIKCLINLGNIIRINAQSVNNKKERNKLKYIYEEVVILAIIMKQKNKDTSIAEKKYFEELLRDVKKKNNEETIFQAIFNDAKKL